MAGKGLASIERFLTTWPVAYLRRCLVVESQVRVQCPPGIESFKEDKVVDVRRALSSLVRFLALTPNHLKYGNNVTCYLF